MNATIETPKNDEPKQISLKELICVLTMTGVLGLGLYFESIFLAVVIIMYFIPWMIAGGRNHPQIGSIAVINVFLGWTLVGFVIALAWACSSVDKKRTRFKTEEEK